MKVHHVVIHQIRPAKTLSKIPDPFGAVLTGAPFNTKQPFVVNRLPHRSAPTQ